MLKFCMRAMVLTIVTINYSWSAVDNNCELSVSRLYERCARESITWAEECSKSPYTIFGTAKGAYIPTTDDYTVFYCATTRCHDPSIQSAYNFTLIPTECVAYVPTDDPSVPPTNPPEILVSQNNNSCGRTGSIIETSNQVIGETIPLVGVPFYLSHFSSRVVGRKGNYKIKIPLSSSVLPQNVAGYNLSITNEQDDTLLTTPLSPIINQSYFYDWDGFDNGIETWGAVKRKIVIKTFSKVSTPIEDKIYNLSIGSFKAKKLGLGGWVPSVWHFYDSVVEKTYSGDGSTRNVKAVQEGLYNRVASSDGSEVYYFDSLGRIALTKTGLTGAVLYTFNYDQESEKLLSITDSFNKVIKFKYDSLGNLAQIISAENIITNFTVDQNGYLKSVTNPKNEIYSMAYIGAGGLLSKFTKPNGVNAVFTYDENGNLLTDVNSGGQSSTLSKTDKGINAISSLGRITQNNYDAKTNTEIEIRPSGLATTYVYAPDFESVSNVISVTKSNIVNDPRFGNQVASYSQTETTNFGTTTINVEDAVDLNDLTNPFSINTLSKTITEGSSEVISHYDGLTRTNTVTTKLGRSISTQLDSLERPILEQAGNTLPKKYTYQNDLLTKIIQGDREIKLAYNPDRKLLSSVKNSENQEVNFYYDQAQRLSAKRLPDGRVINYQYDSNNNLVSISPPGRPAHKLNYGSTEQLSSYVPPSLHGVNNVSTVYSYSLDKELIKISRPDGQVINLNYNPTSGLLSSMTGSFGVISREYQNELVTKITDQNNSIARLGYTGSVVSSLAITDSNQNTVYNYQRVPSASASGRIGSEAISAGSKSQSISYSFDDDKFLTKAGDLNLEYNSPNGQLVRTNLDNVFEKYTYNKIGEVKSYQAKLVKNGKETILYGYKLERDRLGRIVNKVEQFPENRKHERDHDKDELDSKYVYDKAGRLIHVHGHKRNSNYNYDLNSNRIHGHAGDGPFNALYDNQDRLIRFNNNILTYSPNGDLLAKSERVKNAYVNTNFVYDVFGNLKRAGKVTYQIDPLQKRSARLVNGVVTNRYIYNPEGQLIGELDAGGNLLKTFIYASKSHVPDYFVDNTNTAFKIITDQLGSVRLVVNTTSGETVQKMNHDEFGKVLIDTRPMHQPFGFAGGLYDSETKLVRFGVRDYDPETGRWLSKDPIRFNGGDSNLYGYTENDPINWIDTNGAIKKDPAEQTGGAGSGGGSVAYVSPNGQTVITSSSSTITAATNGNGSVITPAGSQCGGNVTRLMGPTQLSPNGYATIQNSSGQYTNASGSVVPSNSAAAHIQPSSPWPGK